MIPGRNTYDSNANEIFLISQGDEKRKHSLRRWNEKKGIPVFHIPFENHNEGPP